MAGLSYFKAQYFGAMFFTLPLLDYDSGGTPTSGVTDWWLIAARRRGRR